MRGPGYTLIRRSASRRVWRGGLLAALATATLAVTPKAWAYKTNFSEKHFGVEVGAGTYFYGGPIQNAWDPVPDLAPTGTDVTGSKSGWLLPIRFGFFADLVNVSTSLFVRYKPSLQIDWKSTGGSAGAGSTTFGSYGGGWNFAFYPYVTPSFRVGVGIQLEYMLERLTLAHKDGATAETLALKSTHLLYGVGLQPELWLGDFYALVLFAGYQSSAKKSYAASAAGELFGETYAAGATGASNQPGGLLIEATLRLSFY